MTMDLEPRDDGHMHIKVGPIEKWVAVGVGAFLSTVLGIFGWQLLGKLEKVDAINTRTLLIEQKVGDISKTVDAIPATVAAHSIQLADHELRIGQGEKERSQLRADVTELQKLKGLR